MRLICLFVRRMRFLFTIARSSMRITFAMTASLVVPKAFRLLALVRPASRRFVPVLKSPVDVDAVVSLARCALAVDRNIAAACDGLARRACPELFVFLVDVGDVGQLVGAVDVLRCDLTCYVRSIGRVICKRRVVGIVAVVILGHLAVVARIIAASGGQRCHGNIQGGELFLYVVERVVVW